MHVMFFPAPLFCSSTAIIHKQLLKYEGYDFAHSRLAPPLRPMVAHEVNLEAMRQAEVRNYGDYVGARVTAVL